MRWREGNNPARFVDRSYGTRGIAAALLHLWCIMESSDSYIHTARGPLSQQVIRTALAYHSTVLELVNRLSTGEELPEMVHALRTHCRRLQALLEIYGLMRNARLIARGVRRLSKLRALQVFRQYLVTIDAPRDDLASVDARLEKQRQRLRHALAYDKITQVVTKHALPSDGVSDLFLLNRLELVRCDHQRRLERLIKTTREAPNRKRLHALRLRIKTIRYQREWLESQTVQSQSFLKKLIRLQALLGRYEELADFRRWGKRLSRRVQKRIRKDWKTSRARAKAAPKTLGWLRRAIGAEDVWMPSSERKG